VIAVYCIEVDAPSWDETERLRLDDTRLPSLERLISPDFWLECFNSAFWKKCLVILEMVFEDHRSSGLLHYPSHPIVREGVEL
jgi:hypothetical protein